MLGNTTEMEVDHPHNLTENSPSSILPLGKNEKEIIEISDVTPVKSKKKRRISETGAEGASKKILNINNLINSTNTTNIADTTRTQTFDTTIDSTTVNIVNSPAPTSIRADLKRLLQSSKDCEIVKYFQIKSNNKLILVQGQFGEAPYRHHPDTINELHLYFNDLKRQNFENGFNLNEFLKEKYPGLIGKLVQDSQVSQSELLTTLRTILVPVASGFVSELQIDSSLLDGIVEKVSYGHPEAGNNFTAWSCTFWQVKDVSLLGSQIGKHFISNYVLRNAARMMLENALSSLSSEVDKKEKENCIVNVDDLPMNLMKIESGTGTPKKREKETPMNNSASCEPVIVAPPPQVKISSFFAKLKKPEGVERVTRVTGEYFQPFFVKPDVTLAPHNQLKLLKSIRLASDTTSAVPEDFLKGFKERRVRIPFKKPTCLCVGYDGKPIRTVLKLFKFEENYRPAYFGTWRKKAPIGSVSARRPFGRIPEVDYDYDSDAEWDEGEDPEGESLSDLDDEEEDEEEDEDEEDEAGDSGDDRSCTGSVDSWLVPHGYLSDDEGGVADEIHLGELEDAAREAELAPPPPRRREKKKFVARDPVLLGPFFGADQVIPQLLQSNTLQFIGTATSHCPFSNCESVFSNFESLLKSVPSETTLEKNSNNTFPESLLASMIQIINSNPSAGITKLYDEFTLQHGKAVSRRLFESKLNQITMGKMKCVRSGKLRWIFKEEVIVSNSPNITADTGYNADVSSCPDTSVVMIID